ncbi:PREDICTED: RNA-directed DNA polymerase from mobile element jockey-like, partial [Cyphomyrmex costatus]|uniref:RNA-directed DNA polymerase from mobile element jockey-like n=1 Tax=Cyphomyrmex costatus TaxID=456900 RepID=UPI000852381C
DFNAHHPSWGSGFRSSSGKILCKIIDDNDLFLLGGKTATFVKTTGTSTSVLDLVMVSSHLAPICDSEVMTDTLGSDHFPVITTVGTQVFLKSKFCYKLPVSDKICCDLKNALCAAAKNLPDLTDTDNDIIHNYNQFTESILETVRSFLPKEKHFPRSSVQSTKLESPPWWNELCSEAVQRRKEAIKGFLSTPSEGTYSEFRKARVDCSKTLSEQKRLGWRKLVGSFNFRTPTNKIWALIRSFKRKSSCSDLSSPERMQAVSEAISKLCPSSSFYNKSQTLADMKAEDELNPNVCTWLDDPFTYEDLRIAIESSRGNSAPGLDQISYRIIKLLPLGFESCLLSIFNEILSQGVFPDSWKTSLVVLIPKPGSSSVRPISLMSCVCKLMERILYRKLS